MAKGTTKKANTEPKKNAKKAATTEKVPVKKSVSRKSTVATANARPRSVKVVEDNLNKPSLRTIYSNNTSTLMPLGFGSDYKTKKCVVIFSDLLTGQVHTTALSVWNRLKLKEVKELNPQT